MLYSGAVLFAKHYFIERPLRKHDEQSRLKAIDGAAQLNSCPGGIICGSLHSTRFPSLSDLCGHFAAPLCLLLLY